MISVYRNHIQTVLTFAPQGWNDVSWHNTNIHSPSLQQLAEEGILLDQYYVQPTCSPSRAAFMTGQYPYRLGRQHMYIKPLMPSGLPANVKIMPEFFKQAGYNTHAVGKGSFNRLNWTILTFF